MMATPGHRADPTAKPALADDIELLQAEVDAEDESHLRLLHDGKHFRYLTIAPGTYNEDDMCFAPILYTILPPFPPGDWNEGYIEIDKEKGQPHFARTTRAQLPGVQSTWHARCVDYLDLKVGEKLRTGLYEVQMPGCSETVIAKFARFDWEIGYLDSECAAYQYIENQGIGPKFLGNITEEGRVIGFLIEYIPDARHAGPDDLEACKEVLGRLHELGILHGDINRHNFLIKEGKAVLIDFDTARKVTDPEILVKEMAALKGSLESASNLGGMEVVMG